MIQLSFDVSVIVLLEFHQPIRSSASGAALANQKLSCWVPLLLKQLWPIRSSTSGAALANQKLSCWVPLGTVTGFHTKPPIMPYFSEFHSVLFIIQRDTYPYPSGKVGLVWDKFQKRQNNTKTDWRTITIRWDSTLLFGTAFTCFPIKMSQNEVKKPYKRFQISDMISHSCDCSLVS